MLDSTDLALLRLLQTDANLTIAELAERVALSPSPCARRVKRLEQEGFIRGYRAELDRKRLGLGTTVFVSVRLQHHREDAVRAFEREIEALPVIVACHVVSGAFDYLLEVVVPDLSGYERFVRSLQALAAVQDINSSFAIRTVKSGGALPLEAGRARLEP